MNLLPAIKEIEKQISDIERQHTEELKPYKDSLHSLIKLNNACEYCHGTGKVFRRTCAEDDGDYYTCSNCNGTGVVNYQEKE